MHMHIHIHIHLPLERAFPENLILWPNEISVEKYNSLMEGTFETYFKFIRCHIKAIWIKRIIFLYSKQFSYIPLSK